MSTSNFKNYAKNKMFIAIYSEHNENEGEEVVQEEGNELRYIFNNLVDKIFGEKYKKYVSLDAGYYEGASVGLDYMEIMYSYGYDVENKYLSQRIALRKRLEKKLIQLKNMLEDGLEFLKVDGLGLAYTLNNGESGYTKYEEGREEI